MAITVTNAIHMEYKKKRVLDQIINNRAFIEDIEINFKNAKAIVFDIDFKSTILKIIVNDFLAVGKIDKAIEVANTIPLAKEKDPALQNIAHELLEVGNIDKAIEIANTISSDSEKESVLQTIGNTLHAIGKSDKAIEITRNKVYSRDCDLLRP